MQGSLLLIIAKLANRSLGINSWSWTDTGAYLIGTDTLHLLKEAGKLIAHSMKMVLDAETDKDFYVKGVYIKVHCKTDETGKVSGFRLEQFDGGVFAKKLN